MDAVAAIFKETTDAVSSPTTSSRKYRGEISKATAKLRNVVGKDIKQQSAKIGRPLRFNMALGETICDRIGQGETLKKICADMNLSFPLVLKWVDQHPDFGDCYRRSRQDMAVNLVDDMIDGIRNLENDRALAARVQADVIRWTAQRFAPSLFADSKRIELKGEVSHTHIHELADHQKRKIAEAWLLSQSEDSPGITAETSGPDLEAVAVREVQEGEQGIVPKRKRSAGALPSPKGEKGKRGRQKKQIDLDQDLD